jgi:hypothetical protein
MWRLAFVLCLLPAGVALAGESRGQLQVGLTITGIPKAVPIGPAPAATAIPLPRARPAAIGRSDPAPTSAGGTRP